MERRLREKYGLTSAEARISACFHEAGSVRKAAESDGVAEATVRRYLKRVYVKTATQGQADLMKLLVLFHLNQPHGTRPVETDQAAKVAEPSGPSLQNRG